MRRKEYKSQLLLYKELLEDYKTKLAKQQEQLETERRVFRAAYDLQEKLAYPQHIVLRPCIVDGQKALFHRWTDSAGPKTPRGLEAETDTAYQRWNVHGIVEFENGVITRVWPSEIQFADTERYMYDAWREIDAAEQSTGE